MQSRLPQRIFQNSLTNITVQLYKIKNKGKSQNVHSMFEVKNDIIECLASTQKLSQIF